MSVLSPDEKLMDAERLLAYIPKDSSQLPALYKSEAEKENVSERDLLYKVLFDMKKDMNDLKRIVLDLSQGDTVNKDILEDHGNLFKDISNVEDISAPVVTPEPVLLNINSESEDYSHHSGEVQDIVHETEEEELSLEKIERELIIKALKKNKNKRKYAAQDLGISERTLYRKIKQYELEDL